jgi:dTDP-4-amino-4,6-dideoxygalactose transaminase
MSTSRASTPRTSRRTSSRCGGVEDVRFFVGRSDDVFTALRACAPAARFDDVPRGRHDSATAMTLTRVPYVDLTLPLRSLKADILKAVEAVLDHGQFILGPEVRRFEKDFSELCGASHAIAVASGTDALLLVLRCLGIGPGDEVVTVAHSFLASASAVALLGARPVFVDVRDDGNIDPELIETAITGRTRAILPVHLAGRPAEMDRILEVAGRHGLPVIEDCAQAVGARYGGRPVGSFGTAGCFSLHPLKTLAACGDGGVIVTRRPELAEHLMRARNHGLADRDHCDFWSYNSRLDSLQAAILEAKLPHVERWVTERRAVAAYYRDALRDAVVVPEERPSEYSAYHLFVIQSTERDALREFLAARGIETRIHYPIPIHLQAAARELGYRRDALPVTERLARTILSLPIYPELTPAQREAVVTGVRRFFGR